MRMNRLSWAITAVLLFLGANILPAYGDVMEHLEKFHPFISLQEEYNSNINVTQDNPLSDFITTVSPGLKYTAKGAGYNFDLAYQLGFNFYAENPNNNYISQDGRLSTFYSFTPRWTFRLNESLTRSRDSFQAYSITTPTGQQTTTDTGQNQGLFLRNIFEPGLDYKFGRENVVTLNYRNMVYRPDGGTSQSSTENNITSGLTYWFNIRQGLSLTYSYTRAEFEQDPNWVGNNVTARYLYRFNPKTIAYGEYRYYIFDFEFPGQDYSIQSPTVGLDHAFSANLAGKVRFGWFWQLMDVGPSLNGPVYNLSISYHVQRTVYTLGFDGGFRENFFTSENLGSSKYNQVTANVTHQLWERLSVGLTGFLSRDEYQLPDRIDLAYGLEGNLSYKPLKWLIVSLQAFFNGRNSDIEGDSYRQNRILLKFTAEF
jgi:hypothetical protein